MLDDSKIIDLYFQRSPDAINISEQKYSKLCKSIVHNVLSDRRDEEEILSDTWLTLWNTIPPKKPLSLCSYICRIVKNLALKKYHYNHAQKRCSEYETSLEELEQCLGNETTEEKILHKELTETINHFLETLSTENRSIFLRRYWFGDSVKSISKTHHISEKTTSMRLSRLREQLKNYLQKEGYQL